jgi:branched-chain amino acid transport system ATP-binding protein
MVEPLLRVEGLRASYGDARALHGVSLELEKGEMLALIGANGAGKSTLLKSICGLVGQIEGRILFKGEDIARRPANRIVRLGIALVPEGRRLFPSLSVEENLILGGKARRPGPWSLENVYALFPVLKERRRQPAPAMSGGQQQMCAIGRALMSNPELLLLDELSLGLSPAVIKDIYELLPRIAGAGVGAILVEQDVTRALATAGRFVCLQEGHVSLAGAPAEHSRDDITRAYFGT